VNALNVRLLMSRLADARVRDALGRYVLVVCIVGFVGSLAALQILGYGLERWVFVLIIWVVLIFIPLRITVEALRPFGARMRRRVADGLADDPRRFERVETLPIVVGDLAAREVTMPRFTKPEHALKARETAVAILRRTATGSDAAATLRAAIRTTLAATATEAVAVSASATGAAADNIQARWDGARALGGLAALVALLAAAYRDRWGGPPDLPELDGRPLRDYLDAAFDYCDEAALEVDALPWVEPPLDSVVDPQSIDGVRAAWKTFLAAGTPAPRALQAVVDVVVAPGARPGV
jgi:hypothetical protein